MLENQASICPIRDVFTQHADLIFGIRIVHNLHPPAPITCKQLVAGPLNAAPSYETNVLAARYPEIHFTVWVVDEGGRVVRRAN
jgi:hypothetical protein